MFTLLKAYSCYQVVAEKIICMNYYGGGYGYILWKDSNGDYQHLMWTIEETDTVFTEDIDTTSAAPAELTGEEFADIIARLNEQYAPNAKDYISMRTENRWDTPSDWMSFYADGVFCNQSDWTEVYILPFYYDGSQYYYGITSCHLYQTVETDDDGVNHVYIDYEFTKYFNSSWVDVGRFGGSTNPIDFSSNRYMDISISSTASHFTTYLYSSYEAYLKKEKTGTTLLDWIDETDFAAVYPASGLANSDLSDRQITYSFGNVVKASEQKDMGYFVSNEPIELYDGGLVTPIDSTKIDPEATVKMTGDTIYDYTITNTTGDTTTINEYVTNNYTYITNNGGDGSSDSGSGTGGYVSGDVNVKGEIAVGGQVDVNVNVNDSDTSSDFLLPADQYAEYLPEVAPEVTEYLEVTYSFLPPEVVGLLIGGIGAAVLCRILGR